VRSLITGVSGFAGSHLAEALLAAPEAEVWGCDIGAARRPYHPATLKLLAADLCDPAETRRVVETCRPERIYHLAAQAFVGESWNNPWTTFETNLRGQVNLLEAVRAVYLETRILVISSSEVYGRVSPQALPLDETCPLQPDSPYGVSKAGQDLLGLQYHLSYGLHVVRVRPFNHIGPRQNRRFVAPAFASQVAAIEAGRQAPAVRVGNLSTRRDMTDVRDMVRAYCLALEHGLPGEVYNLGAGQSHSMRELLEVLLSFATVQIAIDVDPGRFRPSDTPDIVCNASKFRAISGWAPQIPFEQSLRDLLAYERAQLLA
jgi:GDP-4-dehydro-6-deoxy-D-mannose reductase